jgi:hypothetical protein
MLIPTLLLAGAMAFGHGPAADQRPFNASRANAIKAAAMQQEVAPPAPAATSVRYPSADGDILGGIGHGRTVQTSEPYRPMTAGLAPSASRPVSRPPPAMDSTGLLGGPRH